MKHDDNIELLSTFMKNHDDVCYTVTELSEQAMMNKKTVKGIVRIMKRQLLVEVHVSEGMNYYNWRGN